MKRSTMLHSLAVLLLILPVVEPGFGDGTSAGTFAICKSTATANPGVVMVCPAGDGDPLAAAVGGGSCQVTITLINGNDGVPGVPVYDMWLVGYNDGLLLCGGVSGSSADAATDASGVATFSRPLAASGCDTGLYAVVQGIHLTDPATCHAKRLDVATRSPDYKSAGAPGPGPCVGDIPCPDGRVSNADFSWFVTHYPTSANAGVGYNACADYAAPLGGAIGLADFAKFANHFAGAGHACSN